MKNYIRILLLVTLLGIGMAACNGNRRNDRNTDTTSLMSTDSAGTGMSADTTRSKKGNPSDTNLVDTSIKKVTK
jgi:hypothetical protein